MEVKLKEKQHSFKPMELIITIETQDEYDTLKSIFALNLTIPNQLTGFKQEMSKSLLQKIHSLF